MRITTSWAIAAAFAASFALAGCGQSGSDADGQGGFADSFKKGFHEKFVASCVDGAVKSAPATVKVDFKPLCTCAADRLVKDAGLTDLVSIPDAKLNQVMEACVAELKPEGLGTPRPTT